MVEWVRALTWTVSLGLATGRSRPGSNPTAEKLRFGTLAIPLTPLCQCLSEETLKSVSPFYLVSMPVSFRIDENCIDECRLGECV